MFASQTLIELSAHKLTMNYLRETGCAKQLIVIVCRISTVFLCLEPLHYRYFPPKFSGICEWIPHPFALQYRLLHSSPYQGVANAFGPLIFRSESNEEERCRECFNRLSSGCMYFLLEVGNEHYYINASLMIILTGCILI